jgi:hypothetical protein
VSTSALAKTKSLQAKQLFDYFEKAEFIYKQDNEWKLTEQGKLAGGEIKESAKYGNYVVWPEDIDIAQELAGSEAETASDSQSFVTARNIATHFQVSANKVNFILSELGWLKKGLKGWLATDQGLKLGANQLEDRKSGIPYVRWPDSILQKKSLLESIDQIKGKSSQSEPNPEQTDLKNELGFRDKFEAKHRSADGHFVRSKAEMLIDNWLYMAEIVHAYERKLPIEEDVYCDFYIPTGKVYIEYWGYENDERYLARKKKKIEIYQKYGFNLIQLSDSDVQNLDDVLPRHLLKFGVQAY